MGATASVLQTLLSRRAEAKSQEARIRSEIEAIEATMTELSLEEARRAYGVSEGKMVWIVGEKRVRSMLVSQVVVDFENPFGKPSLVGHVQYPFGNTEQRRLIAPFNWYLAEESAIEAYQNR